ncbi:MAG: hypothetical protein ACR2NZ_08195, partial [Rubripirellula sp.]
MTFVGRIPLCFTICLLGITVARAQEERKDPSTQEQTQFAPGVVTVIPPAPHPDETFGQGLSGTGPKGPRTLQALLDSHPEIAFGGDKHPNGE